MKSKAFTVVEMTAVLLVIGLLIVIAVKSSAMVEGARLRAAVLRVQKLQSGFNTMLSISQQAEHERFLNRNVTPSGTYEREQFYANSVLAPSDFRVYGTANKFWDFMTCDEGSSLSDNDTANRHVISTSFNGAYVCLVADNGFNNSDVSEQFACFLETMLDDSHYWNGNIRVNAASSTPENPCLNAGSDERNVHFMLQ